MSPPDHRPPLWHRPLLWGRRPLWHRRLAGVARHRLESLLERLGPVPCLLVFCSLLVMLFVGCYELTGATRERIPAEPAPLSTDLVTDRTVRVRLMGRQVHPAVEGEINAPFTVADANTGHLLLRQDSPLPWSTIRPAPARGLLLGEHTLNADHVVIKPARDAAIVLKHRGNGHNSTYRGALFVERLGDGLVLTNHVDVEAYLRGVLRGELPRYFHPQAFKAQCVAARTYALYQKRLTRTKTFDVYDSEFSQMYIGVRGEDPVAVRAVRETHGEVCTWNNNGHRELFCTYYASACGGRSQHVNNVKAADPAPPPLTGGVICEDCYLARFYRWDPVTITKDEVTRHLVNNYPSIKSLGKITRLRAKGRTPDGRIIRIEAVGETGGNETLMGEDFRLSMGGRRLKSTNFQIEDRGNAFAFTGGKGFGHGIGLCQHGMETKARRGADYRAILATYYPGSTVTRAY